VRRDVSWLGLVIFAACSNAGNSSPSQDLSIHVSDLHLDWFSDWRAATGAGTTAIRDNTKWNDEACSNPLLDVISAAGLGFPTANVLRVDVNSTQCRKVYVNGDMVGTKWPLPTVGTQYLFMRYYFRDALPDGTNAGNPHHMESHVGDIAWAWKHHDPTGGQFDFVWEFPRNNYPDVEFAVRLSTNATYRAEARLFRDSATTAKALVRVYNSSNTLLATNDNFLNGNGTSLTARDPSITRVTSVAQDLQSMDLGQSGQFGSTAGPGLYNYFGGVAVRVTSDANGWIGAYPVAGAE
jgi:hypothetical protein